MNMTHLITASFVAIAMAGCAGAGSDASLSYDGSSNGTHSDSVKCDDAGSIKGSGNVPDGEVLVTLKDSAGRQLLSQTFKGDFTLASKAVSGSSGTWSFSASRTGDDIVGDTFRGDYAFHVTC
jgi:hypothetical protein